MEQPPPDGPEPDAGPPPLRVGGRVVSANATPTFASDPQLGAKGVVQQVDAGGSSYLVRWEDGSESWARRDQLSPAGRGAIARTQAAPGPGPQRAPRPGPPGRRGRFAGAVGPIIFLVILLQGVLRPLLGGDHHIDTGALVVIAFVALPFVIGLVRRFGRS
jgi:hypothetical protein